MSKRLMKGNEAVIYGALLGGATHFFGYPITPASEIAHAAATYFTQSGRTFLQAESEVSSVNMLYGSAAAGARVMTASSGPGIALMGEGLSYIAGAELPCVVVDVQRAGPGLGNIWPEQSDYNMVVKGGGHGNYHNFVLAPNSALEMFDMTRIAFELADTYRITVFVLTDAYIGQMMEAIDISSAVLKGARKPWALYADKESRTNLITSILMNAKLQQQHNEKLQEKYRRIQEECVQTESILTEDAEVVFVAYGICSRICISAVRLLRKAGIKAGILRPKTLFPFPKEELAALIGDRHGRIGEKTFIAVELSEGMMADDVELALRGNARVLRYTWLGGVVPSVNEIVQGVQEDCTEGAIR
ncbi:MAG: 3-methyl-2-oxobutanoate dehydrogenase subunit VorB [Spirochaetales bacterium]|jgi:2-oxoisovalerate ferredoxin oxidoreductase alpha subunit|nr:3-methyl-2-oxobutanoate dehydrogenase subunit VorB [Spirochaetales bacterium]